MNFACYPSLCDKVVVVTGGASGIGADIVRAFYQQGAKLAFVDIQDDAARSLVSECVGAGGGVTPLYRHVDITDIDALEAAFADIAQTLGPVSVLVNNAASDTRHDIEDLTPGLWDESFAVNLRPHFFAARAVHAGMSASGGGSIINLSSVAWHFGIPDLAHYTAAKAAVIGLTHSLAKAFGGDNIRVNAIEPGAVMTERQLKLWYPTQESIDAMVSRQLLQQVLQGDEVARMVLFLASDDARMITRQTFAVDAGLW